eukprot:GHVU01056154.1.p1 GENE.GHVU01056154.1~~GHVU01056154.1.p1  ORF type:complete len:111 (-),score=0.69 GHVU01056154.1:1851-2183(-)
MAMAIDNPGSGMYLQVLTFECQSDLGDAPPGSERCFDPLSSSYFISASVPSRPHPLQSLVSSNHSITQRNPIPHRVFRRSAGTCFALFESRTKSGLAESQTMANEIKFYI